LWRKLRVGTLESPRRRHPTRNKAIRLWRKGNHLGLLKILELMLLLLGILLELVAMLLSILVIPFLLQIISLCFFHHGHDQP
jgi:hypothetical protein